MTKPTSYAPTFVQASTAHPISAHLLAQPKDTNGYGNLTPIKPAVRPDDPSYSKVAGGVADLTAMFAQSLTKEEADWASGKTATSPTQAEPAQVRKAPEFRNAYHAIIDALLLDPTVSVTRLSTITGYSRNWLHKVMSSDSFQAQLAKRRENVVDDHIRTSVQDRLAGLGSRALEILEEALDSDKTPATFALEVLQMTNKAQGLGQPKQQNVANFIVQVPTQAASAADWMAQHNPNGTAPAAVVISTVEAATATPIDITPEGEE